MTVKLNKRAFDHARSLIEVGKHVIDDRGAWSEHQPSARQKNKFIQQHGYAEYTKWHLGIDDEEGENNKGRYKFPYGDFEKVHLYGLRSLGEEEHRPGQRSTGRGRSSTHCGNHHSRNTTTRSSPHGVWGR